MPTGCEVLFDREQAVAMQGLIEGATGKPCPCKEGNTCPLLPAAVKLPAPKVVARMVGLVGLIAMAMVMLRL